MTTTTALTRDAEAVLNVLLVRKGLFDGGYVDSRPKTRTALCNTTYMNDRRVRKAVECLREHHYLVASSTTGAGYWLTTDLDEYRECAERLRVTPRVRAAMYEAIRLERARREGSGEQERLV